MSGWLAVGIGLLLVLAAISKKNVEYFICCKCKKEARIPCHKLDGRILCFECDKKEEVGKRVI